MPIGPVVRRAFGPLEPFITNAYRSAFLNVPLLAETIAGRTRPKRLLEIGCGEGALLTALSSICTDAGMVGIDINPQVGRLFQGDRERVRLVHASMEQYADSRPGCFDVVVMCDVLHHIPAARRRDALRQAAGFLDAGGLFVIKEWVPSRSPMNLLALWSDRYITGDRGVEFISRPALSSLLTDVFGAGCLVGEALIPPRPNNLAPFVRAGAATVERTPP